MSKGLGATERAILTYLRRRPDWSTRLNVICDAVNRHPESVRRALKTLARKGFIELGHDNGWRDIEGEGVMRMWDTSCPTARLSADYLSTLKLSLGS